MNRSGIISVGNWICDIIKFVDKYPEKGTLTTIRHTQTGFGGCSHNVLLDLAALQTELPLYAGGCVGLDSLGDDILKELADAGIDRSAMQRVEAPTSYTDVMSEIGGSTTRTFFHHRGANAHLSPQLIDAIECNAKIFHLGYLLLLDQLDAADEEYGVVAARVLHSLQQRGYKTSVDMVSEVSERVRKVVLPALKYTDYLIINEVEAGVCCERTLRSAEGEILLDQVADAARELMNYGVGEVCLIHFPEGGYILTHKGHSLYCPTIPVAHEDIVSTVGAGDAFCAGALYALHEGYSPREVLTFANASARFNLYGATSTSAAPSLKQITNYLKSL